MLTYRQTLTALANPRGSVAARIVIWTFAGLLLLAAAGIAPRWWQEHQLRASVRANEKTLPEVTVAFPIRASDTTDLILTGNIQAVQEAALYARVDGYLKRRLVTIGDRVQAGQVLAEIDTPELDQQLSQAQATLAQAKSSWQQTRATLQHNETQLEYNRKNLERWRIMKERSLVAQQDLDDRDVLVHAGQSDVDAARANVAAAEANVQANQANVERLLQLQAFHQVRAPFAGVITVRNVDNGALISSGSAAANLPLFRIAQTDDLRIFINLPQAWMTSLVTGMAAEVQLREFPKRKFAARIAGIAGALDPASRTLLIEVHMANTGNLLRPGMYAEVNFHLRRSELPLLIPASALILRSGAPRVATVGSDNKVRFQNVQLGRDYGTTVEIVDGLNEKDRLVVAPGDDLQESDGVRAITAPAASRARPS